MWRFVGRLHANFEVEYAPKSVGKPILTVVIGCLCIQNVSEKFGHSCPIWYNLCLGTFTSFTCISTCMNDLCDVGFICCRALAILHLPLGLWVQMLPLYLLQQCPWMAGCKILWPGSRKTDNTTSEKRYCITCHLQSYVYGMPRITLYSGA